jgi:hypothetical protein
MEKIKKNKGKLFFYGKNCLHGCDSEKKLELFKRYCEGKGKRKRRRKIENGKGKLKTKTTARRKVKAKRKKKTTMQINKEERRRWIENN